MAFPITRFVPAFFYLYLRPASTTATKTFNLMSIRLGDIAPDFKANTTEGFIQLHPWLGDSWGILFSHPSDFTPVCTTELGSAAKLKPEFDKRNVKMLAISVDPIDDHERWLKDVEETQSCSVGFPLVADPHREVALLYDMIHPEASETSTVRSVFIIGPDKKVKLTMTYPASTGRNFTEILRVVDSLQLAAKHQVATPANWKAGEDVIISLAVNDEDADRRFGEVRRVKPYLRYAAMPN